MVGDLAFRVALSFAHDILNFSIWRFQKSIFALKPQMNQIDELH